MKIVIDIDDYIYKAVVNNDDYILEEDVDWISLENAIANGTPLPAHHGRLIDADELLQKHQDFDTYPFPSTTIHNAPTIIEGR